MATYRIEARGDDRKNWQICGEALSGVAATCAIDRALSGFVPMKQAIKVNEATNRIVGRYEKVYDDKRHLFVIKRIGTR